MNGSRNVGAWVTIGMVFAVIAVLMKVASCGIDKALKTRPDAPTRMHVHRGGFTMIEMICVLAIVGMMYALIGIAWTSMHPRARFDKAVSDLHAGISLGRQYAVAKNSPVIVVFAEPQSFATLNNGAVPERCGWAILEASSARWVRPFQELDGAVWSRDSLWDAKRNVLTLSDGGDSWQLLYTNIPELTTATTNPPRRMYPGVAITADGKLHLGHGGTVDRCRKPKGVVLAPGQYTGSQEAGWIPQVLSSRRTAVTVTAAGSVMIDQIVE